MISSVPAVDLFCPVLFEMMIFFVFSFLGFHTELNAKRISEQKEIYSLPLRDCDIHMKCFLFPFFPFFFEKKTIAS